MSREFPEGGNWRDVQSLPPHMRRLHNQQQRAIRQSRSEAKADAEGRKWLGLRETVWLGLPKAIRRVIVRDDYPSL